MENNSSFGTELMPEKVPTSDEKTMALLSHILTVVFPILAPLVIYLIKKDESEFVASHAKESLNFQITLILIMIVLVISVIGIFFTWIVAIAGFVLIILATIKASEGKLYKYPFSIRLIK